MQGTCRRVLVHTIENALEALTDLQTVTDSRRRSLSEQTIT